MRFEFEKMSQANALVIADDWKYEGEYAFYDMTADVEDYEEFICEEARNENDHYQAMVDGVLAGYFCVMEGGSEIELGLGLLPDICGKGIGRDFLNQIIRFVSERYQFDKIILRVAAFNQRAIKVYRACGFTGEQMEKVETNCGVYEFLTLVRNR